jgi:hypothetical protein
MPDLFKGFCQRHFGDGEVFFNEIGQVIKVPNSLNQILFRVVPRLTKDSARNTLLEDAAALAESGNVLVFGVGSILDYRSYFDSAITLRHVHDRESLNNLLSLPKSQKKTVVSLTDDFAVGFDIKFNEGASVFVLGHRDMSKDELFQRFARGARSLNNIRGTLYYEGGMGDAVAVKTRIQNDRGHDFKEGAQVIDFFLERAETPNMMRPFRRALAAAKRTPWHNMLGLLEEIGPADQEKLVKSKGKFMLKNK